MEREFDDNRRRIFEILLSVADPNELNPKDQAELDGLIQRNTMLRVAYHGVAEDGRKIGEMERTEIEAGRCEEDIDMARCRDAGAKAEELAYANGERRHDVLEAIYCNASEAEERRIKADRQAPTPPSGPSMDAMTVRNLTPWITVDDIYCGQCDYSLLRPLSRHTDHGGEDRCDNCGNLFAVTRPLLEAHRRREALLSVWEVNADLDSGLWDGEPHRTDETATHADWMSRDDTDAIHYDTFDVELPCTHRTETRLIRIVWQGIKAERLEDAE